MLFSQVLPGAHRAVLNADLNAAFAIETYESLHLIRHVASCGSNQGLGVR